MGGIFPLRRLDRAVLYTQAAIFGGALVAAVGIAKAPRMVPVLLLAALAPLVVLVGLRRPVWLAITAGALVWLPLPPSVHLGRTVGGFDLRLSFVVLVFAVVAVKAVDRERMPGFRLFAVLVAAGAAHGYLSHAGHVAIGNEGFSLATFLLTAVLVHRLGPVEGARLLRGLRWVLWAGFGMIVASAAGFGAIGGTVGVASLRTGSSLASLDAVRYQTPMTHLGLVVLCAGVGYLIAGGRQRRTALLLIAPAAGITFLAFSRNSVVALAVAAVFALLACRTPGMVGRVGAVLFATIIGVGLVLSFSALSGAGRGEVAAYRTRVLSTLTAGSAKTDANLQARLTEDGYAKKAWEASPIVGRGLGVAYREPYGPESYVFGHSFGTYGAHNNWWWLLAKLGVVGLGGALWLLGRPVARVLRLDWRAGVSVERRAVHIGAGAALAGMLVAMLFVPMLEAPDSAAAVGLLLGLLYVPLRSGAGCEAEEATVASGGDGA